MSIRNLNGLFQEERVQWLDTTITVRPSKPEDERLYASFFAALTPEDIRQRFIGMISALMHHDLARMAQLDHDREMALIAVRRNAGGIEQILGEARSAIDADNEAADFSIMVRSDLKQRGLGTLLLSSLIHYQRGRGTRQLRGTVMADNAAMLELARHCGFTMESDGPGGEVRVRLDLDHITGPR
ncbi:MAG TPA: GNAT family N-acetyltransferase [Bordetella sp.]|jgi:acetyltransferase|nr:GNAT family N-acetyltransferase [Bordetella sp.]